MTSKVPYMGAEYRPSDYRFARQQSGAEPLEQSKPMRPLWHDIAAAAVVFGLIALWWIV